MKKILVATHGLLADGIKSHLEILTGLQEQVTYVNAFVNKVDVDEEINNFFESCKENDEIVVFTDLYGGSLTQKIVKEYLKDNVFLITGFNLPIILEVLLSKEEITKDFITQKINECRNQMQLVDLLNDELECEDDFFS